MGSHLLPFLQRWIGLLTLPSPPHLIHKRTWRPGPERRRFRGASLPSSPPAGSVKISSSPQPASLARRAPSPRMRRRPGARARSCRARRNSGASAWPAGSQRLERGAGPRVQGLSARSRALRTEGRGAAAFATRAAWSRRPAATDESSQHSPRALLS